MKTAVSRKQLKVRAPTSIGSTYMVFIPSSVNTATGMVKCNIARWTQNRLRSRRHGFWLFLFIKNMTWNEIASDHSIHSEPSRPEQHDRREPPPSWTTVRLTVTNAKHHSAAGSSGTQQSAGWDLINLHTILLIYTPILLIIYTLILLAHTHQFYLSIHTHFITTLYP
jgi:hypothetical protein